MKLAVVYDSKTGNTKQGAEWIVEGMNSVDTVEAKAFNIKECDEEFIKEAKGLIIGSPSYAATMTPDIHGWMFANSKKFTSNAAKRDFVNSMIAKDLKMDNDKILGADDFVTAYSIDNADAFIVEKADPEPAKPKPTFVNPTGGNDPAAGGSEFAFNFTGVRPKEE